MIKIKIKKIVFILFTIALVVSIFIGAAITYISLNARPILEKAIGQSLNTTVKIKDLSLDKKNNIIKLKDMSVYNPQGFDKNIVLADIPILTARYDLRTPFKNNKLHFPELNLYIKTLTVIKNIDGKLNIEELKILDTDINLLPIWVDNLIVSVDNLLYQELKKYGPPSIEMFEVNIKNKGYRDLASIDHVAMNIVIDALKKTTIKGTALYVSATLAGVSTAGAGIFTTAVLIQNKKITAEFQENFDNVYNASLETVRSITSSFKENKKSGIITAQLHDTTISIKITRLNSGKIQVSVSASMLIAPKIRVAKAILYEISQKLNKRI